MQLTRRGILKTAMAAPLAFVPHVAVGATWRRHLVLVELNGGNDGLNTVVPYRDPLYRQMRSKLALPTDQVLSLDERLGLHAQQRLANLPGQRDLGVQRRLGGDLGPLPEREQDGLRAEPQGGDGSVD